jgi:Kef-type K+ transport system membrane component KefB
MLPPVALAVFDYPMGGVGTGMAQNAAASLHVSSPYAAEAELHRYLVELGVVGFLLMWSLRLGLVVALLRAYKILKQAERRGGAGAALSYAAVTFFGNLTFDHIWQALYFVGVAFILAETRSALEVLRAAAQKRTAVGPPAITVTTS